MHNDYFADLSFRPKSTLQPHPRPSLYDGDHPFMDEPRDALRLDIRSTLTKRDFEIPGLAPQVEYTYSKDWSNAPFDSFEAHGASLTLTKQFQGPPR